MERADADIGDMGDSGLGGVRGRPLASVDAVGRGGVNGGVAGSGCVASIASSLPVAIDAGAVDGVSRVKYRASPPVYRGGLEGGVAGGVPPAPPPISSSAMACLLALMLLLRSRQKSLHRV